MEQTQSKLASRLPEMLGALSHANQYLKMFSIGMVVLTALVTAALIVQVTRPPLVLTLTPGADVLQREAPPTAEDQVRSAVRAYIEKRYQWEPATVKDRLEGAKAFVLPASLKAYQGAVASIVAFSTEKLVSQRVYPDKIDVDLSKGTAVLGGDRVTVIQGLRAAGALHLELSFASGPRTQTNPWGIYITQEKELQ